MISRRRFTMGAGLVASGLAQANATELNTWVVPFSAGSAQDTIARLLAPQFAQTLGKQIIIQNISGAGGTIGAASVAKSQPDGRTLLLAASSLHLSGALHPQLSYHPLNSFRAGAFLGFSEYVLVASADLHVVSLGEFVKRAAASPRTLNFGSSGTGSATHVAMATFLARSGLDLTHIPFKGTGETVQHLLAGRIHAAMLPMLVAYQFQTEARLVPLASTGLQRSLHLPSLPTFSESGYPGFQLTSWAGLLAPKSVPDSTIIRIDETMRDVLSDPLVKRQLHAIGVTSSHLGYEQFDRLLHSDWSKATANVRQLKISAD